VLEISSKSAADELTTALDGSLALKLGVARSVDSDDWRWAEEVLRKQPPALLEAEISSGRTIVEKFIDGPFFDAFSLDHGSLIPKELRHTTGTYYTPFWLARYVLRSNGYNANISDFHKTRIVDPTCGSGVFLLAAAEEVRKAVLAGQLSVTDAVESITHRFHGIDIDPLAAERCSANLALALIALIQASNSAGPLSLENIKSRDSLLDDPGVTQADLVVGNPPWVNWEYLPPTYRAEHADLWPELGLFDLQGRDKAFSKEDVSALFFATAVDKYLVDGGRIAFLVPQALIKAALNHRAFRKFSLRQGSLSEVNFKVEEIEDFVAIRPFEGVANRTILIKASRGSITTYPVSHRRWVHIPASARAELSRDTPGLEVYEEIAEPSDADQPTSHWTTGPERALSALRQVRGDSFYRARTGVFTGGANGVFHLTPHGEDGGLVRVANITERAKRIVPNVRASIESDYLYPLLRGREVTQWRYEPTSLILLPHTADTKMEPVSERDLAQKAPETLAYLAQFREILAERAGFVGWERKVLETGFYACQRIGEYTFSAWKVVWRYIAPSFITAVVGPHKSADVFNGRPIIPNEKLMSIACRSEEEAYYLCGLLSCSLSVAFVESRMVSTQIAPHLIQKLRLPAFDPANAVHARLSSLCREGHVTVAAGAKPDDCVEEVDAWGAKAFGATWESAQELRSVIRMERETEEHVI
jgi:methylase of polypeptide subunit release factors